MLLGLRGPVCCCHAMAWAEAGAGRRTTGSWAASPARWQQQRHRLCPWTFGWRPLLTLRHSGAALQPWSSWMWPQQQLHKKQTVDRQLVQMALSTSLCCGSNQQHRQESRCFVHLGMQHSPAGLLHPPRCRRRCCCCPCPPAATACSASPITRPGLPMQATTLTTSAPSPAMSASAAASCRARCACEGVPAKGLEERSFFPCFHAVAACYKHPTSCKHPGIPGSQ